MIENFKCKETEKIFHGSYSKKFDKNLYRRMVVKLDALNVAVKLSDLKEPISNRLHSLQGNREGQYSISINKQYRLCLKFIDSNAYDVEIVDYH